MPDQFAQDRNMVPDSRAEFEADAEPMGFDLTRISLPVPEPWSEYADENTGHRWGGWLAATQRQQERIAELEAQVQALSLDAARYQFLRAGGAYLEPNSEEIYMATDDGGKYYHDRRDLDMDIDAAIAAGKGEAS